MFFSRSALLANYIATVLKTKLLMEFEGTNGGTNIIEDTGLTVTNTGITTSSTQFIVGSTAGFFNGTSNWASVPNDGRFNITGDFTVEAWVNYTYSGGAANTVFGTFQWKAGYQGGWVIYINNSGANKYSLAYGNSSYVVAETSGNTIVPQGTWTHLAIQRSGSALQFFWNGIPDGTATFSGAFGVPIYWATDMRIGADITDGGAIVNYMHGYIDQARCVVGSALYNYTTGFLPTNQPYTTLSAQSSYVANGSVFDTFATSVGLLLNGEVVPNNSGLGNAHVGGFGYDESVSASHTYNDNAPEYIGSFSPLNFGGGSAYMFPGSFCYFGTISAKVWTGSGDFGFEAFVMFNALGAQIIMSTGSGGSTGFNFFLNSSNNFVFQRYDAAQVTTATNVTVVTNQWYHVAIAQVGSSMSMFVNGIKTVGTVITGMPNTVQSLQVGTGNGSNATFSGYIGPVRITAGSAVYSPSASSITVPTTRLSNVTGATWVVNWDTALVPDKTGNMNLGCRGSIVGSTAQYRTGTGALPLDGTSQCLLSTNSMMKPLGTGDFTIDAWFYPIATTSVIFDMVNNGSAAGPTLQANGSSILQWVAAGAVKINSSVAMNMSTWNHIAVCRSNGTTYLYVNGLPGGSYVDTQNYISYPGAAIGSQYSGPNYFSKGYLDDFRLTYAARYPGGTSFTPPFTAAFIPTTAAGAYELYMDFETSATLDTGRHNGTSSALTITNNSVTTSLGSGTRSTFMVANFTGSGSYLVQSAPTNANLYMPYQIDFTLAAWVYVTTTGTASSILMLSKGTANSYATDHTLNFILNSSNTPALNYSTGAASPSTATATVAVTASTWTYVAVTYNSFAKTATFWVGGNFAGQSSMSTYAPPLLSQGQVTQRVTIGRQDPIITSGQLNFTGSMDNVCIAKGIQLYKLPFTPT